MLKGKKKRTDETWKILSWFSWTWNSVIFRSLFFLQGQIVPPSVGHSLPYSLRLHSVAFLFILICIIQHKESCLLQESNSICFFAETVMYWLRCPLLWKFFNRLDKNSNQNGGLIKLHHKPPGSCAVIVLSGTLLQYPIAQPVVQQTKPQDSFVLLWLFLALSKSLKKVGLCLIRLITVCECIHTSDTGSITGKICHRTLSED
jgi:hypothetical protein